MWKPKNPLVALFPKRSFIVAGKKVFPGLKAESSAKYLQILNNKIISRDILMKHRNDKKRFLMAL